MASGQQIDRVFADSKTLVELFRRLQENLTKASDKNDTLLESIESSEARAGDSSEVKKEGGAHSVSCLEAC